MSEFSERMRHESKRVAGTTRFQRSRSWRARKGPWTCVECGAAVIDPERHAAFHAFTAGNLDRLPPPDCGDPEHTDKLTVAINGTGRPIG